MFTPEQNIECFQQTRELSFNDYISKETQKTINNTRIYHEPTKCIVPNNQYANKIDFVILDTVSTIFNVKNNTNERVAALNFADPFEPGGLVIQGAQTQEESLCRCSNLYESLIKDECKEEYYLYNRSLNNRAFSDRIIYSPDVAFFRDNTTFNITDNYVKCDIITCPAPHGQVRVLGREVYYNTLLKRIRGILKVAASNECTVIILGAWGCGAFGNVPLIVAQAFKQAIIEEKCFNQVIFAMYSNDKTYEIFRSILG